MTEDEIRADIATLISSYKKIDEVEQTPSQKRNAEIRSLQNACETLGVRLVTQIIIDFHRIAEAQAFMHAQLISNQQEYDGK